MRRKTIWTLIILLAGMISQVKAQDTSFEEKLALDLLNRYMEGIEQFDNDLIDHFPSTVQKRKDFSYVTPAGASSIGMAYMFFSHEVDTTSFEEVLERLLINEIPWYNPRDSTLILVNDTLDYTDMVEGIPIPNFENYEGDFGINRKYLPERFKIYVLESRQGKYLKNHADIGKIHWPNQYVWLVRK